MKNKYLLMGWPYGCPPSTQLPYQNDYDMLSIENSIIKLLNERNCDFTYKVHPDRKDETFRIYKNIIKSFEFDKYEKIYEKYDTIIFSYPHTTTFFFTLENHNKIIFFDNKNENYLDESAYAYICQRARVIAFKRLIKNNFEFIFNKPEEIFI